MNTKSKVNLGRWIANRLYLSDQEKRVIIEDYLAGNETKKDVYKRCTGYAVEHGKITKWMRKLGYSENLVKSVKFTPMPKKSSNRETDSAKFDNLRLKKRVEELEKHLKEAEMKATAYSTMVDIAEKQFNIPIRKKYNTKS